MASHYKFYDGFNEIVPWTAKYQYPTQANRTWKSIVKLPPRNGSTFINTSHQTIQIDFPSQSYLDTNNSFLTFDLTLNAPTACQNLRIQNNVQSIFKRVRIMYGSMVIEDLNDYGKLMRLLSDGAGTNQDSFADQTSIYEGIGALKSTLVDAGTSACLVNTRLNEIQSHTPLVPVGGATILPAGIFNGTRKYKVQLGLGLMIQNKLLPLKWMASQLSIHLDLSSSAECLCGTIFTGDESFTLSNIAYEAQLLDFDGAYDAAFLEGLRGDGVPIKFATWDRFINATAGASTITNSYPERNRSIKAAFCVQCTLPYFGTVAGGGEAIDSHAFMQSTTGFAQTTPYCTAGSHLKQFQWRVGGKYYPSQPVICGNGTVTNGAAEAYTEFAKALNIVGDYRLSTGISAKRWCRTTGTSDNYAISSAYDWAGLDATTVATNVNTVKGPSFFVVAGDFETSDGSEVSGINGEEQNDISLTLEYSSAQLATASFYTFIYYDALLILRENNLVEIIK